MLNDFEPVYRLFKNNGKIYIDYRPTSKERIRKSLGLDHNEKNLKSIERNIERVLLQLNDKQSQKKEISTTLASFGLEALESTSFNRTNRTQDDYVSKFNRLILPHFENYNISEIKVIHVDQWQKKLLPQYSTTTVKRCKTILSMIFDKAIANELITINPVQYSTKFNVQHQQQDPYTLEEMEIILKFTIGWFQTFMYLAFTTGMRPGELLGLKWSDIDFTRGVINLQRSISKGIVTEDTFTKNHNRLIIVPTPVIDMLKGLHHDKEYIFVNNQGNPFYESKSVAKGYLEPFCKDFNISYKGLKATRHTYVSIMRNGGASQEFILDIVGHSKAVSDKHYYKNELTSQKQEAVNNVFSILFDKSQDHIKTMTKTKTA